VTSVATHLGIRLDEYDARIRTFIPDYEVMINTAVQALATLIRDTPHIVDLGTGTGAFASACLQAVPTARLTLVDEDPKILDVAYGRLASATDRITAIVGSFLDVALPRCDAILGSFAFHHVHDADLKSQVYRRVRRALDEHGVFVMVDCCPPADAQLAAKGHAAWRDHLKRSYSDEETDGYLAGWAKEDVYFSLPHELEMLTVAGFSPDIVWRRELFAVIAAR
jgi:tRNA (cmo5U34)-methyltransferase